MGFNLRYITPMSRSYLFMGSNLWGKNENCGKTVVVPSGYGGYRGDTA